MDPTYQIKIQNPDTGPKHKGLYIDPNPVPMVALETIRPGPDEYIVSAPEGILPDCDLLKFQNIDGILEHVTALLKETVDKANRGLEMVYGFYSEGGHLVPKAEALLLPENPSMRVAFVQEGLYSKAYTNPTFKDLLVEAEEFIHRTEDFHHIFLEGILRRPSDNTSHCDWEIELVFGS